MVIVNTLKCNFRCAHCCFDCGPSRKDSISREIFLDAINKVSSGYIHIVGGEPFLHEDIMWQLWQANSRVGEVTMVSNGSWIYSNLVKSRLRKGSERYGINWEEIHIRISNDSFHAPFHKHPLTQTANSIKWFFEEIFGMSPGVHIEPPRTKVYPLGRARVNHVSTIEQVGETCDCYASTSEAGCEIDSMTYDQCISPTVFPNGDLSICCNGYGIIGSIYDTDDTINSRYRDFLRKGKFDCSTCPKKIY